MKHFLIIPSSEGTQEGVSPTIFGGITVGGPEESDNSLFGLAWVVYRIVVAG